MTNPVSLRKRLKTYFESHHIESTLPSIVGCTAMIEVVAQATNLSVDELSRKIELSPMSVPRKIPDLRQMDLFTETS